MPGIKHLLIYQHPASKKVLVESGNNTVNTYMNMYGVPDDTLKGI